MNWPVFIASTVAWLALGMTLLNSFFAISISRMLRDHLKEDHPL